MQSIAIAALIVRGDLPRPDYMAIADTGYERGSTWQTMATLKRNGLDVTRVRASDYATVELWGGKDKTTLLIPAFSSLGRNGPSKLSGYCSNEWKRRVIDRWLREQGVTKFRNWLGFSTDEKHRAKNHDAWYPLIEMGMSRTDCLSLIDKMGWPIPSRSSCWMCPNHSAAEWQEIKDSSDWPLVLDFERQMQTQDGHAWLTADCKPIAQIDFSDPNLDLFATDCESGVCFV